MRKNTWPRLLAALCCLLLLSPLAGQALTTDYYVSNPNPEDRLNLRAGAGKDEESLGRFYNGTLVHVDGEKGDYMQVRIGTLKGYMQKEYLSESRPAQWGFGPKPWGIVNVEASGGKINLRKSASDKATILKTYPNGTAVQILGTEGNYYHVRAADMDGYMQKDLLLSTATSDLEPGYAFEYAIVRNDKVNLRAFPSREGVSMEQLKKGIRVVPLAMLGPWCYVVVGEDVSDPSAQLGFILGNQIELYAQDAGASLYVVASPNESDRLNLREDKTEKSESLARYFNGQVVEVLSKDGKWFSVRVLKEGGTYVEGYMDSTYLQEVKILPAGRSDG